MNCPRKDKCSAPLCPLDPASMRQLWYPDEEICGHKDYLKEMFVRQQKKIKKRHKDKDSYHTFAMLSEESIVKKGMTGDGPDRAYPPQVAIWYRKHPPISEKRRTASKLAGARFGMGNLSTGRPEK